MTTSSRTKRQRCCKGFVCQLANLPTWQLGNGQSVQPSRKTCSTAQSARRRGAKRRRRGRNHVAWGTDRFPSCQVPSLNDRSSLAVVTSAALPALPGTSGGHKLVQAGGTSRAATNAWNAWWRATCSHHSWHQQASRVHPLRANSHNITDTSDILLVHPV